MFKLNLEKLVLIAIPFVMALGYFIFNSHHLFVDLFYENGDFALQSLDIIKAKDFLVWTSGTSSLQEFCHPGPVLTYLYAAAECCVMQKNTLKLIVP